MPRRKSQRLGFRLENKPLFALGALLLTAFLVYRIHLLIRLSFAGNLPPIVTTEVNLPAPNKIVIPTVNINLPVFPTVINNNLWQIDARGISHLAASANPGQAGAIILYGHNTNDRFGPLHWLSVDSQILLTDEENQVHHYQVSEILTVSPSQLEVLRADTEMLILYTCTGFLDRQRLVVKARPL